MSDSTINPEVAPEGRETPDFTDRVRAEYERLVPPGTQFTWVNRAERFVKQGADNLWQEYQTASNTEKIVMGGIAVVGAYLGLKLLKAAIDTVFDLGRWMIDKVNNIRKDSIELILKLTLGATAIALVPLLYEAISKGNLSLSDVSNAWDENGAEGVIKLLAEKFPQGVKSISDDVKNFIIGIIGANKFREWFGNIRLPGTEEEPGETEEPPTDRPDENQPPINFQPSETTADRLKAFFESPSMESFTFLINSLIENEGGVVVSEGKIWLSNEVGELFDLSRWLTLQYFSSVGDVIAAGEEDPEARIGAYIFQYLKETPKFMILASSLEFINLLRGRHASFVLRPAISALTWGAWPIKLIGPAKRLITGEVAFARFTRDGVVFLSRAGVNIAKLTAQGSVLIWQGGKFIAREVARQTARLGISKAIGAAITRRYTATIGAQVANFTGKAFLEKLAVTAGWKGAAAAALWADDATVIGVLDDVVAVGLTAWLAADVYEIIRITREAMRFKSLMEEQQGLEIVSLEALDEDTRRRLEEVTETLSDKASVDFLSGIPRAQFRITRENGRSEEYLMVRGKIIQCKIVENGVSLAEFSEEDVETLSKELPPPQDFNAWEIDYSTDREQLFSHYRLAFTYVINETGWSSLDYEIKDENTIEIKRRTSDKVVMIHREGTQWYIGEDKDTKFNLFQAISMANLINRVEEIILNEMSVPSGQRPFYAEEDGIFISRPLNDTTILSGEEQSWYQRFYQNQLGLKPEDITHTLNTYYEKYIRPRLDERIDDYMKDFIPG